MRWLDGPRLLVLALCFVLNPTYSLLRPASFSFDHSHSFEGNVSLSRVLEIVSQYEVDSHLEVVLVGRRFGDMRKVLQARLESMAKVSALSSPLSHVHEKIIYHLSADTGLEDKIESIILSSPSSPSSTSSSSSETTIITVNPNKIAKELAEYHGNGFTATSLFVFDLDVHREIPTKQLSVAMKQGIDRREKYSYESMVDGCAQRTFLTQKAFAWMDLSAHSDEIMPAARSHGVGAVDEILPPLGQAFVATAGEEERTAALAAVVHRSGEGFFQFPAHLPVIGGSSDPYFRQVSALRSSSSHSFPPNTLDVAIITICLEGAAADGGVCKADAVTQEAIQELSDEYKASNLNIRRDVLSYTMEAEPQLAHAYYASLRIVSSSSSAGGEEVTILDSQQFMQWLGTGSLVRQLVQNFAGRDLSVGHEYVPVFVIKGGPSDSIFVDSVGTATKSVPFPQPPGGWGGRTYLEKISSETRSKEHRKTYTEKSRENSDAKGEWPTHAVLAVRSGGTAKIDELALQCGASTAVPAATGTNVLVRAAREVRQGVQEAVWGVGPPHQHYSGASRSVVRDYAWYTPPALVSDIPTATDSAAGAVVNGASSFLEARTISRHAFINKAEGILRHLSSMLTAAQAMDPPVNVGYLLDLHTEEEGGDGKESADSATPAAQRSPFETGKQQKNNDATAQWMAGGGGSSSSSIKKGAKGVRGFASDGLFSEFLRLMDRAANDFSHLEFELAMSELGNALAKVEMMEARLEEIILSRSATVFCDEGSSEAFSGNGEGDGEEQGSGGEGDSGLLRWILLCGAVFAGSAAGSAVKDKIRKNKRKHFL